MEDVRGAYGAISKGAAQPFRDKVADAPASSTVGSRVVEYDDNCIVKESFLKTLGFDVGVSIVGGPDKRLNNVEKNHLLTSYKIHNEEIAQRHACMLPSFFGADHNNDILKAKVRLMLHEACFASAAMGRGSCCAADFRDAGL